MPGLLNVMDRGRGLKWAAMEHRDFEALAQEHLTALYNYCLTLTGDPHQAEELAQETLTRAYLAFDSLRDQDRFFAWLRGIARRCSWTWLRWARQRVFGDDTDILEQVEDPSGTPSDCLNKRETDRKVWNALKKLTQRNREVIVLRFFEGLSYADIALRLGVTVDAVDQRLTRTKLKLKRLLQDVET